VHGHLRRGRRAGAVACHRDDLEPTLTRNGYDAAALTVLLKAKPAEVRDFLAGTLASDRTREFTEQLRVAGVPI
jgi:hypothetical protein